MLQYLSLINSYFLSKKMLKMENLGILEKTVQLINGVDEKEVIVRNMGDEVWDPVDDLSIQRKLTHSASVDIQKSMQLDARLESRVLVLYTGGTIGMVRNTDGVLVPQPNVMENKIRRIVTMHDQDYSKMRFAAFGTQDTVPLVLPPIPGMKRVVYSIYEYDPILDSSNMTMDDWIQIASDIKSSYHMFDGFVILHGTDTLAYTSSALSFMLENLGKTIIVTGSQIPCFETRSDGRDNIVGALILAGNYCIPEVSVYFNHKLMRGNRTVKVSSGSLHAFESPNLPPLATVGINITVDYRSLWKSGKIKALNVQANLCRDVVLLRLFPSISTETIKHFLTPPIKGVVLQCYGAGNMPSNRKDIIAAIESATKQGVLVVSCTQCSHGAVSGEYETGRALMNAGVIPSSDITPEAALTKLSYVLAKSELSLEEKRKVMESSIRGEMTVQFEVVNPRTLEMQTNETNQLDLIDQVARAMNLTSGEEIDNLNSILFPSLLCSVVYLGDTSRLAVLEENQPDFSAPDYSGKTGLHIAAALGNDSMVEWLLERGANVHARDMNNDTPLLVAARAGKESTVKVLAQCGGAHGLTLSELGDLMVLEAGQGHIDQLRCLLQAGASPDICSVINGNTALHAAIEGNHLSVCELLLSVGGSVDIPNIYGYTAKHISTLLHREHLLKIERKMTNGNNS